MNRMTLCLYVCLLWIPCGCRQVQSPSAPLIGITSVYEPAKEDRSAQTTVSFTYVVAVVENGGVPIVLPTIDDERILQRYINMLDGLVLIGGDDIPPAAYGERPHETVEPLPVQRYDFERELIAQWLASGKPLLGVCLGMQFTNVVAGGSLVQDIPSEIGTTVDHHKHHRVQIVRPSILADILDTNEATVLSNHHQAVERLGRGLRVVARSEDGVIEALERTDGKFGLFVQWHPEAMDDLAHRNAIYGALIRACVRPRQSACLNGVSLQQERGPWVGRQRQAESSGACPWCYTPDEPSASRRGCVTSRSPWQLSHRGAGYICGPVPCACGGGC